MENLKKVHVVCVVFCNENLTAVNKKINSFFANCQDSIASITVINTAKDLSYKGVRVCQSKLNSLYEFTGYHYGMELVKEKYSINYPVCFINDTIFTSHISSYYKLQLIEFLKKNIPLEERFVYGDFQEKFHGLIVPTCFFIVNTSENAGFCFFDKSMFLEEREHFIPNKPIEMLFVGEKTLFNDSIKNWLNPTGFLSGWYKAYPNKPLELKTYNRKRLAIFLEHSLLKNNESFALYAATSFGVKFFRFIDVNYQRLQKAILRTFNLLGMK